MNRIYIGKDANMCDGSIYGYSNFLHILTNEVKIQEKGDTRLFENIVRGNYKYDTKQDYSFQHKYRV